ncbi:ABC transporter substrate-binding protein [Gordonia sp. NPDC003504]
MRNSRLMLRGLVVAVAIGMTAFLGACSSPDEDSSSSDASFSPVTITHEYGSTEIKAKPTRVVTLLTDWTDTLAALDIPITASFVPESSPTYSWTPQNNAEVVKVADPTQVTVAELAKYNPDLILAGPLGDQNRYNQLSEIAPTIPLINKGATVDTWEQLATTTGQIFGVQDQAQKLIDETNAKISKFKSDNPGSQGKTFTFAQVMPTGQIGAVNTTEDPAAGLIAQLGFTLNPEVAAQHTEGQTRSRISPERIDLLNSDLLIAYVPGGDFAAVQKIPGWSNLTAVKNGTVVFLNDDTQPAFSVPSAPSVGFVINTLNPVAAKL